MTTITVDVEVATRVVNEEFLVAFLKWLTEPGFPLRWAASKGMTTFALNHLDACGLAYVELGDVKKACAHVQDISVTNILHEMEFRSEEE